MKTSLETSPSLRSGPRRWSGVAVLIIAGVHTALGVLAGLRLLPDPQMDRLAGDRVPLLELGPGFALSPTADALTMTMFWFLAFGIALVPLGSLLLSLERTGRSIPCAVGVQLGLLAVGGGFFLPASGFWLALLPAFNIWAQARHAAAEEGS